MSDIVRYAHDRCKKNKEKKGQQKHTHNNNNKNNIIQLSIEPIYYRIIIFDQFLETY